ncbi:MAG: hypothetical protein HUK40_14775 [Desulfobacter sp.]|nr:hypothetical protein [Desulfobacter sp.]WDP87627.1 MAG: hypothetical protein HUN05_22925 [Desulfobacter sp.]
MKPHGRKIKKQVRSILEKCTRTEAMAQFKKIPDAQLTGHLFSHFYHLDELIKYRSVTAMGELAVRISAHTMEKARIILRRIMWNLNDESGGIGWGSPEAMGEILSKSPQLSKEFKSILFSYLDHRGNHIEHEMLQRGVLWGIGTYLQAFPQDLTRTTAQQIMAHLDSPDPVRRGFALRALLNAGSLDQKRMPPHIKTDNHPIDIYTGWDLVHIPISKLALPGHKA